MSIDTTDEEWTELRFSAAQARRRTGKSLLHCVGCGHPMHPKGNEAGTRWFAHDPDRATDCVLRVLDGESPKHPYLKELHYRAIKRVRGRRADLEVSAPEPDPLTGRSIVVDVVAERERAHPREPASLHGFEIQLGALDQGRVLERQEQREGRWLDRCIWVLRVDVIRKKDGGLATRYEIAEVKNLSQASAVEPQLISYLSRLRGYGLEVNRSRDLNDEGWVVFYYEGTGSSAVKWYAWAPPGLPGHIYFAKEDDTPASVKSSPNAHETGHELVLAREDLGNSYEPLIPIPLPFPLRPPQLIRLV